MKKFILLLILFYSVTSAAGEVFFVPGWRTGFTPRSGCVRIINDIWPGLPVTVKSWNSRVSLRCATRNAAEYSRQLKSEITAMPAERRKNLILIGHSLGAAIVLDVLEHLAANDMKVHEAVLLGAPVPDDELSVFRALSAVETRLSNVSFAGDAILKLFYPWHMGKPLGIAGWRYSHPRFAQFITKTDFSFTNHYAYIYLETLGKFLDSLPHPEPEIKIANSCQAHFYDESAVFWQTIENCKSWKLQKNLVFDKFRIVDEVNQVRATGSYDQMQASFAGITAQLSAAGAK